MTPFQPAFLCGLPVASAWKRHLSIWPVRHSYLSTWHVRHSSLSTWPVRHSSLSTWPVRHSSLSTWPVRHSSLSTWPVRHFSLHRPLCRCVVARHKCLHVISASTTEEEVAHKANVSLLKLFVFIEFLQTSPPKRVYCPLVAFYSVILFEYKNKRIHVLWEVTESIMLYIRDRRLQGHGTTSPRLWIETLILRTCEL